MTDRMGIAINDRCALQFPRVILTFDERTLTLSTQCVNALKKLQQSNFDGLHDDGLRHFFEEFGTLNSYLAGLIT